MTYQDWWLSPDDEAVDLDCIPARLGARIRQERIKRGLDKKAFAQAIGVSERRLRAIENDAGKPLTAVQLAAMAVAGLDVPYVLTGTKSAQLKPEEAAIVDNYRNSTPAGQASLREVGTAFAQQAEGMKKAMEGNGK